MKKFLGSMIVILLLAGASSDGPLFPWFNLSCTFTLFAAVIRAHAGKGRQKKGEIARLTRSLKVREIATNRLRAMDSKDYATKFGSLL